MFHALTKWYRTTFGIFAVVALTALLTVEARGQDPLMTPLPAPPPFKMLPREERSQLAGARDAKARTRLSIELAEARLLRAEQMTTAQQFQSAAKELGFYQAIAEDSVRYLKEQPEQKKMRDIYKRLELALRSHGTRLESMRRTTPAEFAVNIKTITDYTKSLRAEALNGFYGDTVIREGADREQEAAPAGNKPSGSSRSTPEDQP